MLKKEIVIEQLVESGVFESKAEAKEFDKKMGEVIEAISSLLPEKEKAKFGGIALENRFVKGREGVSKLGGVEKKWKTEDGYKVVVKLSN